MHVLFLVWLETARYGWCPFAVAVHTICSKYDDHMNLEEPTHLLVEALALGGGDVSAYDDGFNFIFILLGAAYPRDLVCQLV